MKGLLICGQVKDDLLDEILGVKRKVPSGCVKMTCTDCDVMIWVSPSSLIIMHDEDVELVCMACAGAKKHDAGGINLRPPTDGQKEEIKENKSLWE